MRAAGLALLLICVVAPPAFAIEDSGITHADQVEAKVVLPAPVDSDVPGADLGEAEGGDASADEGATVEDDDEVTGAHSSAGDKQPVKAARKDAKAKGTDKADTSTEESDPVSDKTGDASDTLKEALDDDDAGDAADDLQVSSAKVPSGKKESDEAAAVSTEEKGSSDKAAPKQQGSEPHAPAKSDAADKAVQDAANDLQESDDETDSSEAAEAKQPKKHQKSSRGKSSKSTDEHGDLGEGVGAGAGVGVGMKAPKAAAAAPAPKKKAGGKAAGKAYIPLNPTVPKLTVADTQTVKGLFQVTSPNRRQFHVNSFADVSSTAAGAAFFGGNMHVLTANKKNQFRYSNTHGQLGGMAFATHYPHYNKASIISSNTKSAKVNGNFKPSVVTTFTGKGEVGIGVSGPASKLHVQGEGNTRLLNVNHWGDMSACSTGIGLFAGNAYVTTESNSALFRYSNSHSAIGAIGLAMHYPSWNKASFITSGTKNARGKKAFKPKTIATFTHKGLVGIGTTRPKSLLAVKSKERALSVNDWIDISSQGSAGFIGMNAHMVMRASKRLFSFSNTAKSMGAIGVATNFPLLNQLSIVSSKESSSNKGTLFKPHAIATFTHKGLSGFGTDTPKSKVDVRNPAGRQISANKYADVSANEQLQGFFAGNGYAVGREFQFSNTHNILGAIGLATHYPKPGEASIISSGDVQPKAGKPFKPVVLAHFTKDGSLKVKKNLVVTGDLVVKGRMLNGDDTQLDMMAAQEALLKENLALRERMTQMETMMASMMSTR
jgi:hypothetical protein